MAHSLPNSGYEIITLIRNQDPTTEIGRLNIESALFAFEVYVFALTAGNLFAPRLPIQMVRSAALRALDGYLGQEDSERAYYIGRLVSCLNGADKSLQPPLAIRNRPNTLHNDPTVVINVPEPIPEPVPEPITDFSNPVRIFLPTPSKSCRPEKTAKELAQLRADKNYVQGKKTLAKVKKNRTEVAKKRKILGNPSSCGAK